MADVTKAQAARKTARKTTARKVAARKPAARKAAPKRTRKPAARIPAISIEKVQDAVREVAFAQLGFAGLVYDGVNARASQARKDAPKQWDALVKRGERVQRELAKTGKGLGRDLQARVDTLDAKARLEQRLADVRKVVSKLSERVRKAA